MLDRVLNILVVTIRILVINEENVLLIVNGMLFIHGTQGNRFVLDVPDY